MATSYFLGFDVVQRGDDGLTLQLANTDVDVYSVAQAMIIDTLTTDAYGVIPSQSVDTQPDDTLQFSVSGFSPVFERTTFATLEEVEGGAISFVVDDQLIFTPKTPIETEVWLVNADDPDYPPKLLGRFQPGQTIVVPHDTAIDGTNLDLYLINRDEKDIPDVLGLNEARKISVNTGLASKFVVDSLSSNEVALVDKELIVSDAFSASDAVGSQQVLMLDGFSAAFAYGLFRMSKNYSGACIRIIRLSDNAELDIGFVGNDLDTALIASHCAGTTGEIVKFYDIGGNGKTATAESGARRAVIYESGAVVVDGNGKPTCIFDGSVDNYTLDDTALAFSQPYTISMMAYQAGAANRIIGGGNNSNFFIEANAGGTAFNAWAGSNFALSATTTNENLVSFVFNSSSSIQKLNGDSSATGDAGTEATGSAWRIGRYGATDSYYWNGNFSMFVVFASALTSGDLSTLHARANDHFGIY